MISPTAVPRVATDCGCHAGLRRSHPYNPQQVSAYLIAGFLSSLQTNHRPHCFWKRALSQESSGILELPGVFDHQNRSFFRGCSLWESYPPSKSIIMPAPVISCDQSAIDKHLERNHSSLTLTRDVATHRAHSPIRNP